MQATLYRRAGILAPGGDGPRGIFGSSAFLPCEAPRLPPCEGQADGSRASGHSVSPMMLIIVAGGVGGGRGGSVSLSPALPRDHRPCPRPRRTQQRELVSLLRPGRARTWPGTSREVPVSITAQCAREWWWWWWYVRGGTCVVVVRTRVWTMGRCTGEGSGSSMASDGACSNMSLPAA